MNLKSYILLIPALLSCSGKPTMATVGEGDTYINQSEMQDIGVDTIRNADVDTDNRFASAAEAYDEGYYNGWQEGYTDSTHSLDFGYNFDDSPTYSGYSESYKSGYEKGYVEGYDADGC